MTGGAGDGARGRGGGQGRGQGARRRRRDGSGAGMGRGQGLGGGLRDGSGGGTGRGLGRGVGLVATAVPPAPASPTTQPVTALPQADPPIPALTPKRPRPVAVVAHPDSCTLCEACLDACPRGAITLTEAPEVDARLCIGCGDCEAACPNNVFELATV